ncbi:FAD-dependent oxidoreductase [Granulicella paludicola]|uniref:FAD-dependent oxidoreductase n=1 Tax=Granulicella paludicola TaxID=474951 RepID=UPI0021E056E2|nr:cyclic nucleotide-binding domain-containing thioredoxin-disulfide reductase [Granulicella paludicola]
MSEEQNNPVIPAPMATYRAEMAFPSLTDEMLVRLQSYGRPDTFEANVSLWSRGQREVDMFVLLEGSIEVFVRDEQDDTQVYVTIHEKQFSGELDMLSSRPTLVNGRTATACRILRIPRPELQRLMRSEGDIANLIMQAIIWRRLGILENATAGIVLLGSSTAAETIQLQRFLTRNSYPHRLLEPTAEQSACSEARDLAGGEKFLPAILFTDGTILHRPTIAELADQLGLTEQLDPETTYDITVVGAGPAGLAAAVYGASEGLCTLVVEGTAPGGQAGTSSKIENYLGFPTGVSGQELANRALVQAQKFGARLAISRDVVGIDQVEGMHHVRLSDGTTLHSRSIVIATGAAYRKLSVPNYERFEGQGIQYAATAMEAVLCRHQEVAVVGGGNSAGQAAIFLSGIAKHVHLIIRGRALAATMSQYLISRIENSSRITLHVCTEIERLDGEKSLSSATWINQGTGQRETRDIGSLFVMIGAEPNTGWLYGTLALDKKGFVITGTEKAFENTRYATSVPGIYAVGDARSDSVKRVASAVGEGSVVVSDIHRYLARQIEVGADANSTLAAMQASH